MDNVNTLVAVIQQLREIFLEKGELRGYDDWDRLFGCIKAIESVIQNLNAEPEAEETPDIPMIHEVVEDG